MRLREAALKRIGRARAWAVASAGALTAAIALAFSSAVPGRTLGSKSGAQRVARMRRVARGRVGWNFFLNL